MRFFKVGSYRNNINPQRFLFKLEIGVLYSYLFEHIYKFMDGGWGIILLILCMFVHRRDNYLRSQEKRRYHFATEF